MCVCVCVASRPVSLSMLQTTDAAKPHLCVHVPQIIGSACDIPNFGALRMSPSASFIRIQRNEEGFKAQDVMIN